MTQKEELTTALTRITELEAAATVSAQTISSLESEKAQLTSDLAAANLKIEGFTAQVTDKDAKIAELTARAEAAEAKDKTAETRAQEIAARHSANLPDKSAEANAGGSKDIVAEYEAITDPVARTTFFRKNKAAIHEANRQLKTVKAA